MLGVDPIAGPQPAALEHQWHLVELLPRRTFAHGGAR